ncbi:hypothetical protein G3I77_32075 [Streptomyces sp. D2-8]|uniref:hypothetical protein n=1 Tax=Streptomyces sp. D2-8 TaxID=2707767 RepID=UPI0020C12B0C|nr:hypothetical protein [Streptomyces sp. D2-8]MCK8437468.1 hypothetical protein [Streptomyces sp. D2-8]
MTRRCSRSAGRPVWTPPRHSVAGETVVPNTVLAELAVRAGDEEGCTAVGELVVDTPLVLPRTGALHLQVRVAELDATSRRLLTVHA